MAMKIGKAKIGAGTAIGTLVGGPAGAAVGAAYDNKGGLKQISKDVGGMNPYKKVNTDVPQVDESRLQQIGAPQEFDKAGFSTKVLNAVPQDEFRQGQSAVAKQLQAQALGQGPSIANMQMQQGQAAALAQSRAALASQRGAASPLAARAALMGNQQTQLGIAEKAGIARLQEQQTAAQNYGSLAQQARGQDLELAKAQAAQQNDFNSLRQNYMNSGMDAAKANQQAALDYERIRLGQGTAQANADAEAKRRQQQQVGGLINQVAGVGSSLIMPKSKPAGA